MSHYLHKVRKNPGKLLCSCLTLSAASLLPALPEIVFMLFRFKNIKKFNFLLEYLKMNRGCFITMFNIQVLVNSPELIDHSIPSLNT